MFFDTRAALARGARQRALRQQTWFSEFRVQVGRVGCVEDPIAEEVVLSGAVATAAGERVIAEAVKHSAAAGHSTSSSLRCMRSHRCSMPTKREGSLLSRASLLGVACSHSPAPLAEIKLRWALRAKGFVGEASWVATRFSTASDKAR